MAMASSELERRRRRAVASVMVAGLLAGDIGYGDRKSTRLNSSHLGISYAVFCLKKKNIEPLPITVGRPTLSPLDVGQGGPTQGHGELQRQQAIGRHQTGESHAGQTHHGKSYHWT